MPRNTSGNYTLPAGNPVVADTLIETTWANPTLADVASAITDSLDRYGRGGMLAEFKIADGVATAPGLSFVSQSNLGVYRAGESLLGVAAGGVCVATFGANSIELLKPIVFDGAAKLADGSAAAPALGFASETGMGLYRSAPGSLSVAVGGVEQAQFNLGGVSTAMLQADGIVCLDDITALGVINATDALYVNQLTPAAWSGVIGQKNGLRRWMFRFTDDGAEAAGNVGSDFLVMRADNAGNLLVPNPLGISRATGKTTVASLDVVGPLAALTSLLTPTLTATGPSSIYGLTITGGFEFNTGVVSSSVVNKKGAPGGNLLYLGWNGKLTFQVDNSDFGSNFPIDISGRAASAGTLLHAGNGNPMLFSFSGQPGTPTWIWGSNDGVNIYVWSAAGMTVGAASNAGALGGVGPGGYVTTNKVQSGSATTNGVGAFSVTFNTAFGNPSITCNAESAGTKCIVTITGRTNANFTGRVNNDAGADVAGVLVNWIAMERTQG